VDREWEKLGYQDAILKLYHDNAERGLRRVRRYARGRYAPASPPPRRAPPAPRSPSAAPANGARPAEGAGQLTRGGHQHGGRKRRATCRRRATSSASPPPRSKARAVSSSTALGQPAPLRIRSPHHLRQRQSCWLAASCSEGRAAAAVGNSSAKPTSSTNAPARPMLRISAGPPATSATPAWPQGHPCRDCTTSLDGRASVDQEPQGAWSLPISAMSQRATDTNGARGRQAPAGGAGRQPAGRAAAPRWP
jgi:hypothetical protein